MTVPDWCEVWKEGRQVAGVFIDLNKADRIEIVGAPPDIILGGIMLWIYIPNSTAIFSSVEVFPTTEDARRRFLPDK